MLTKLRQLAFQAVHSTKVLLATMAKAAQAVAPQKNTLRLNPLVALRPTRRGPTGVELAYLRTQKRSGLSYRAGRSKYAPQELKNAVLLSRLRAVGAV